MPEFTTHYIFGQSILDEFSPEIVSIIKNNLSAFNWGLQGPDLLFYSSVLRDSGRIARAGASLHRLDPEAIFSDILNFILKYKNHPGYLSLCSYFYGFVCHYALDSTSHPYIYYIINNLDGQITTARHAQVESEIGSLMYTRMTGMPISDFKIYDCYTANGAFVKPVSKMYVNLIKTMLDKTVSENEVKSGFSICLFLNRLTYLLANKKLSSKVRTAVLKSTKVLVKRSDFLNSFIKSDNVEDDTLNLMHNEWCNLNAPEDTYICSFPELFDIAKAEAVDISQKCGEMLKEGKITPLGLTESFDNGEPEKKVRVKSEKLNRKELIKGRT